MVNKTRLLPRLDPTLNVGVWQNVCYELNLEQQTCQLSWDLDRLLAAGSFRGEIFLDDDGDDGG